MHFYQIIVLLYISIIAQSTIAIPGFLSTLFTGETKDVAAVVGTRPKMAINEAHPGLQKAIDDGMPGGRFPKELGGARMSVSRLNLMHGEEVAAVDNVFSFVGRYNKLSPDELRAARMKARDNIEVAKARAINTGDDIALQEIRVSEARFNLLMNAAEETKGVKSLDDYRAQIMNNLKTVHQNEMKTFMAEARPYNIGDMLGQNLHNAITYVLEKVRSGFMKLSSEAPKPAPSFA